MELMLRVSRDVTALCPKKKIRKGNAVNLFFLASDISGNVPKISRLCFLDLLRFLSVKSSDVDFLILRRIKVVKGKGFYRIAFSRNRLVYETTNSCPNSRKGRVVRELFSWQWLSIAEAYFEQLKIGSIRYRNKIYVQQLEAKYPSAELMTYFRGN